jgi:hypothetical protein
MGTPSTKNTSVRIEGTVRVWSLDPTGQKMREYIEVNLPFEQARLAFKADHFDYRIGRGEQRQVVPSQVRKLRQSMEAHAYTPTQVSAGLRPYHRAALVVRDGVARLAVSPAAPLPLTDGQQRFAALEAIYEAATAAGDDQLRDLVLALPVSVVVLLDGC